MVWEGVNSRRGPQIQRGREGETKWGDIIQIEDPQWQGRSGGNSHSLGPTNTLIRHWLKWCIFHISSALCKNSESRNFYFFSFYFIIVSPENVFLSLKNFKNIYFPDIIFVKNSESQFLCEIPKGHKSHFVEKKLWAKN